MATTIEATKPARVRPRLRGPLACAAAAARIFVGLLVDVIEHLRIVDDAEHGIFDVSNPGHLISGAALVMLAGAVCLALADARGVAPRRAVAIAVVAAVAAAGAGAWLASVERSAGAHHADETADATHGDHGDDVAAGSGDHAHSQSDPPDPAQIELIRTATDKYRDIEVALADGYRQTNEDEPGEGAHFENAARSAVRQLDLRLPAFLLYTQRRAGTWELIGVGYNVDQTIYRKAPSELVGAHWHQHNRSCEVPGQPFSQFLDNISEAKCKAMNGTYSSTSAWEVHVWLIENPGGVFANENTLLA